MCYKSPVDIVYRVLEMQVIILALLEKFEFSLPPQSKKVYRKPGYIMLPMAEGEKGIWMGLIIKPVNR